MDEQEAAQLNSDLAEALQRLEVAIGALREIGTPQHQWSVRHGGPAQAMEARAREALTELGLGSVQ